MATNKTTTETSKEQSFLEIIAEKLKEAFSDFWKENKDSVVGLLKAFANDVLEKFKTLLKK
jgi:hypothetical protein